jgi:hypothetical protein
MAMLRGFKLVHTEGEQIGLTDLGKHLVNASDPEGQVAARRAAVLNLKAYRELIESFDGTELPEIGTLASRLQFDYGKSEELSTRAAQAFIDSVRHAGMVDPQNIVLRNGVEITPNAVIVYSSEASSVANNAQADDDEVDAEIDLAFAENNARDDSKQAIAPVAPTPSKQSSPESNISLSMTLDLSNFRADEVVNILNTLGFGGHD